LARKGWAYRSGWKVVVMDFLGLVVALNVFALFHHVIPVYGGGAKLHIVSVGAENADDSVSEGDGAPEEASVEAFASMVTPRPAVAPGDFSATFPTWDTGVGKFQSHQSDDVRIAIDRMQRGGATGYVADVWIRNISFFKTAFAKREYGRAIHELPVITADREKAILAMSGDYYGAREKGVVIRNGDLYRESVNADTCVLYADGVMETFGKTEFDLKAAILRGAYQAWSFGPRLLEDGKALEKFDSAIEEPNPRAAIGYYEPGHYAFVVIDGRQPGYSTGATLQQLAKYFESLGCREAYNLDGGKSAMMIFGGDVISQPDDGGRKISDILYIGGASQ